MPFSRTSRAQDADRPALSAATAYSKAIRILGARAMSSEAMRQRLERVGAAPTTAAEVVARLIAERWINDLAFATAVARRGFVDQGWSERRIRLSLRRSGIGAEVADEAIAAASSEVDTKRDDKLLRLAQRKWESLVARATLEPRARRMRFAAWLARRGFSGDDVRRLTDQVTRSDR
jgi:regulatory protein